MAVRFLSVTRRYPVDLCRLTPSAVNRSVVGLFSTAAEHHSAGDDCHGDDGDDDHSHSVTHIRTLETRARKLEEQVHDLTERYKRALADSDSVRRRTQKYVEDAKLFGIQSFCRDIVEVADLLEKVEEGDGVQQLTQYMAHIQGRLQDIFTKHGLEKMRPVGSTYDPYQHEIVCHTPAEGVEPGSIAVVKQDGYMLHGRTIRHALVGIAVKTQEQ
ncbi:grpE protein homolog 2, mitochondrial-like [Carassius auratus]|uniref:GrpE protein homolog 2, mitochondrial-like n=1 Tax=Carassius auratus TaxID=7957 RepID=A0A6P6IWF5_CARAU|nr:grpE protein homolog 2, mitochondrial-like [Carassius auratus]XP_052444423.1 grpE protein homolog 2, mitochondrial [Carassius gibelio]